MSGNKRYYYLKIKENFYNLKEIKQLEALENGYRYVDVYLKMLCNADLYKFGYRLIENKFNISNIKYISCSICVEESIIEKCFSEFINTNLLQLCGSIMILRDVNIDINRDRTTKQYKKWRSDVFKRDNFSCQMCGQRGIRLNAHHIKPWATHEDLRFELNNGITLCKTCHKLIHKKGGNSNGR